MTPAQLIQLQADVRDTDECVHGEVPADWPGHHDAPHEQTTCCVVGMLYDRVEDLRCEIHRLAKSEGRLLAERDHLANTVENLHDQTARTRRAAEEVSQKMAEIQNRAWLPVDG